MLIVYNIIQILGLIVLAPLLLVKIVLTPKYRGRVLKRFGIGLADLDSIRSLKRPRIWIHALSLGEVTSSASLVKAVRQVMPKAAILFSATTRAGEQHARTILQGHVDCFVPFPIDLWWSAKRFISLLEPDLFVLVETDFWPNFLTLLKRRRIASVLVNGRISQNSFERYRLFRGIFLPLFDSFKFIAMQTEEDAQKMIGLGVSPEKVKPLGNLKYDAVFPAAASDKPTLSREQLGIPPQAMLLVAGSTHAGEEEIIFTVYRRLRSLFPRLFLAVAPRDVARGGKVLAIARQHDLNCYARSGPPGNHNGDVLILDTLGELAGLYALCDVAFVGGSLVAEGGHNPVEPAAFGKPVLFGPHMEDFSEISEDLLAAGGGMMVKTEEELFRELKTLLGNNEIQEHMGAMAKRRVEQQQGVTARHVALISEILGRGQGNEPEV